MNQPAFSPDADAVKVKITATQLAQYVAARQRCERYLRFAIFPSEYKAMEDRYSAHPEPLSQLLADSGNVFEQQVIAEIEKSAPLVVMKNKTADGFTDTVRNQSESHALYYQPLLEGRMGQTRCEGRADLIEIVRNEDGSVDATVIDIKASRRESIGFRLQIAFYARLLKVAINKLGLQTRSVKGAILSSGGVLSLTTVERFDLHLFEDEIERLVAAPQSDVERIKRKNLADVSYHLDARCDGCPFNAVCFIDTAEREDLSLVPSLTATEKRALQIEGITTARALAGLMSYDSRVMRPADGRETEVERIGRRWPLGGRLPLLAQHARAAIRAFDKGVEARSFTLGSGFGSLPDPQQFPDLVKVFVDAQHDYIEDRVYVLAAVVASPDKTIEVVEMAEAPPDTDAEREILVRWLTRLLPAIVDAAGADYASLHVYLYDRRDQRVLLDALTRHFDALCAIPAFYDLLTSSPALTQGMISFLIDEVRERRNLSPICQNLYRVASAMNFDWRENELDFWKRFLPRAFGYRKAFTRDPQTGMFRRVSNAEEPGALHVEAVSRFGVQIPLEYAYSAWDKLRESQAADEETRRQIRGFLGVTTEEIQRLALHRCRALHHIETQFSRKNFSIEKAPIAMAGLDRVEVEPHEVPLSRSLEDFLLLEHHAKHQAALIYLAQPADLRAQTGSTAILRCDSYVRGDDGVDRGVFSFVNLNGEPVGRNEFGNLRFQDGGWMVLNPTTKDDGSPLSASALVKGRLAVIEQIDESKIELRLLRMSFKGARFRYGHRNFAPQLGEIYTLDEMVDDLNADKYLEACRNAAHNHLYGWLNEAYQNPSAQKPLRAIRPVRLRAGREFAELAAQSQQPYGLTAAQLEIVGGKFAELALIVQGPPGTGKSHTIGFAILARALALKTPVRPFRVAVAAKTHAAVEIVLKSVMSRLTDLLAAFPNDARLNLLKQAHIVKVGNDPGERVPAGVDLVLADGSDGQSASEQWYELMTDPLLIVGGTPGGLYRLIKKGAARGRELDWSEEHFDLVVVDEASQMSITEAITAAAFLRTDGQFIAVGDHRQMPPILSHAWDQDSRRDLQRARPHLSIFEYLIALDFPRAALDESFRIPAEVAEFLGRHIYARDGIDYRSQNRARLPEVAECDEWVAAALAPEHPMILIEHDEEGSQQSNEYEASLVESLIQVATEQLGLDANKGVGVVVPHRAQKALLRSRLPLLEDAIDTVERFQGGERDLIVVSATVSDREYAQTESEFLLDPRRLTVAVSRPKRKLIVLASRSVFDLIPGDLDEYERGSLWKHLRRECAETLLWTGRVGERALSVYSLRNSQEKATPED
jgi:CRISPR/Cas system-associated exonuclease Cas4 (RecB family)